MDTTRADKKLAIIIMGLPTHLMPPVSHEIIFLKISTSVFIIFCSRLRFQEDIEDEKESLKVFNIVEWKQKTRSSRFSIFLFNLEYILSGFKIVASWLYSAQSLKLATYKTSIKSFTFVNRTLIFYSSHL